MIIILNEIIRYFIIYLERKTLRNYELENTPNMTNKFIENLSSKYNEIHF